MGLEKTIEELEPRVYFLYPARPALHQFYMNILGTDDKVSVYAIDLGDSKYQLMPYYKICNFVHIQ